ncbi:MAG TPA: hypothetical protein VHT53_01955 [Candidatus Elarobacter sp.]|jgi:hypothetical protein|nr:hypothetical protein [Candidatus Elarobacter sp.]
MVSLVRDPLADRPVVREWRPAVISAFALIALAAGALFLIEVRHWSAMQAVATPCLITANVLIFTARITDPRERFRWFALGWGVLIAYAAVVAVLYALVGYPERLLAISTAMLVTVSVQVVVIVCILLRRGAGTPQPSR